MLRIYILLFKNILRVQKLPNIYKNTQLFAVFALKCNNNFIHWFSFNDFQKRWASSIAVRALAYRAEDPRLETNLEPWVGRSLNAHPAANGGPGGNTGEEKNCGYPTSQSRWPRTSVLSSRRCPNVWIV